MKALLALVLTGCGLSLQGEDLPRIDSGPQLTAVARDASDVRATEAAPPIAREAGEPEAAVTVERDAAPEAESEASDDAAPEASVTESSAPAPVESGTITFCLGCLDDRGICFAGNMTTACGKNGQKCMDCTTAGLQHVCGIPNYVCL